MVLLKLIKQVVLFVCVCVCVLLASESRPQWGGGRKTCDIYVPYVHRLESARKIL